MAEAVDGADAQVSVPRVLDDRLAGVRAKIDRATDHLESLHREIDGFRHGQTYVISDYFDRERSSYIFWLELIEQPSLRVGVIVGELVHDLRSALDHLVWQLIKSNGGKPRGAPSYPILRERPGDFRAFARGSSNCPGPLRGVSDDALAIIESTQPYHGGDCLHLGNLNRMWNRDKHRFLTPTVVLVRPDTLLTSRYEGNVDAGPLLNIRLGDPDRATERSAELVVIGLRPAGPNPKVKMEGHPPIDVAIGDGPPLIDMLSALLEHVLIRVFRPLDDLIQ